MCEDGHSQVIKAASKGFFVEFSLIFSNKAVVLKIMQGTRGNQRDLPLSPVVLRRIRCMRLLFQQLQRDPQRFPTESPRLE